MDFIRVNKDKTCIIYGCMRRQREIERDRERSWRQVMHKCETIAVPTGPPTRMILFKTYLLQLLWDTVCFWYLRPKTIQNSQKPWLNSDV